jgi:Type IV secretion system pilin
MDTLTKLKTLVTMLQQNAVGVGVAIAALMVVVYAIQIMFDNDTSPAARNQRWEKLTKVLICAGLIVAAGALVQFSTGLGKLL